MTEYAPRSSQDRNPFYSNPQLGMSQQYSNGNGGWQYFNNGQIPYPAVNGSCSAYTSPPYLPAQNGASASMYMPPTSSVGLYPYHALPPARSSTQMQQGHRTMYHPGHAGTVPTQRSTVQPPRLALGTDLNLNPMADIESQESFNQESMLSEPIIPSLDGYPDVKEFDELMRRYTFYLRVFH
jgi:hypothetical protein